MNEETEETDQDEVQYELPLEEESPIQIPPKKEKSPKACIGNCNICFYCDGD